MEVKKVTSIFVDMVFFLWYTSVDFLRLEAMKCRRKTLPWFFRL